MAAGPWQAMQLPLKIECTYEEYHTQELWKQATLEVCPVHKDGLCRIQRNGVYWRYGPHGKGRTCVARFVCIRIDEDGRVVKLSFSLLPQFFAARTRGTLQEYEDQVAAAESEGPWKASLKHAPHKRSERRDAFRWLSRRMEALHRGLKGIVGHLPDIFKGCEATVSSMRKALGREDLLLHLRQELAGSGQAVILQKTLSPVGFRPHR